MSIGYWNSVLYCERGEHIMLSGWPQSKLWPLLVLQSNENTKSMGYKWVVYTEFIKWIAPNDLLFLSSFRYMNIEQRFIRQKHTMSDKNCPFWCNITAKQLKTKAFIIPTTVYWALFFRLITEQQHTHTQIIRTSNFNNEPINFSIAKIRNEPKQNSFVTGVSVQVMTHIGLLWENWRLLV